MERRIFIKLSSFTAAAICFSQLSGCKADDKTISLSRPKFLSRLVDDNAIRQSGRDYMKIPGSETNKENLIASLTKGLNSSNSNVAEIETMLDKQIQNDFDRGQTVVANGWILSVTEARQCALYSLM